METPGRNIFKFLYDFALNLTRFLYLYIRNVCADKVNGNPWAHRLFTFYIILALIFITYNMFRFDAKLGLRVFGGSFQPLNRCIFRSFHVS